MSSSNCYWSTNKEIEQRTWADWISSHTSFLPPLHHNVGTVELKKSNLVLTGTSKKTKLPIKISLEKSRIKKIALEFDDCFRRSLTRGLGLTFVPLSVHMDDGNGTVYYLMIDYNLVWATTQNAKWKNILTEWLEK